MFVATLQDAGGEFAAVADTCGDNCIVN